MASRLSPTTPHVSNGALRDSDTRAIIGPATRAQRDASRAAGPEGHVLIDERGAVVAERGPGVRRVFVESWAVPPKGVAKVAVAPPAAKPTPAPIPAAAIVARLDEARRLLAGVTGPAAVALRDAVLAAIAAGWPVDAALAAALPQGVPAATTAPTPAAAATPAPAPASAPAPAPYVEPAPKTLSDIRRAIALVGRAREALRDVIGSAPGAARSALIAADAALVEAEDDAERAAARAAARSVIKPGYAATPRY